jgi:hypothetical protein
MGFFQRYLDLWVAAAVAAAVAAVVVLVTGIFAPARLRGFFVRLWAWLPAMALVAAIVVFLVLEVRYPLDDRLRDTPLPAGAKAHYWIWILFAILGMVASAVVLGRGLRPGLRPSRTEGPLDESWTALRARLEQARVDLARQPVHIVLAPDPDGESLVARLARSADFRLIAEAPAGPAPVHAYAIRDGVLLSCDGAWPGGRQAEGAARLADLGLKLRAGGPDRPPITGLAVLFPFEWAGRSEAVDQAAVAGEEIRILYQAFGYRSPVRAIFTGLETVPGAPEFIRRLAALDPRKVEARVGFEVPGSATFDAELARLAIDWIAAFFHARVLDLLVADPFDSRGNSELVRFDAEFRRRRHRLAAILEAAFLDLPHGEERILFQGGYFTALGEEPGTRAFAAGLLHGPGHPILARRRGATWTDEAFREDRRYWWAALGLALAVGLAAAWTWLGICSRLGWVGWTGLGSIALVWALVLLWPRRAWRTAGPDGDAPSD